MAPATFCGRVVRELGPESTKLLITSPERELKSELGKSSECCPYLLGTNRSCPPLGIPDQTRVGAKDVADMCVAFGSLFAIEFVIGFTCDGSVLYGYRECKVVSDRLANAYSPIFVLSMVGGVVCGVMLILLCGFIEIRARWRRN